MTELTEMIALDLIIAREDAMKRVKELTEQLKQARADQQAVENEMRNRANRPLPHTEPEPEQASRRRSK